MGASRQTQRAQEHAQRRIARDTDMRAENELLTAALEEALTTGEGLLEQRDAALRRENIMRDERDRLRDERDAIARTAAKAGDVLEEVIRDRDRRRAALDEIADYARASLDDFAKFNMTNRAALDVLEILSRHGFGGDQ